MARLEDTENIEEFGRFRAARAAALIETDLAYDLSPGMIMASSGTAIVPEQTEFEIAEMSYLRQLAREYDDVFDVTASASFTIVYIGDGPSKTSDSLDILYSIAGPAGDTMADTEIGEAAELTDELQAVVEYARGHGLQGIADRLVELDQQPLSDDEAPLQAESACFFVEYCVARQKQTRPLMTVTPTGELDATWKGSEEQSQVMRFFPNGSVWVAYKLLRGRGSFEAAAADVLDPDFHYKIPDWA